MRALSLSPVHMPRLYLLARIGHALALRRQRQHLALLDAHQLSDIGLTRKNVASSRFQGEILEMCGRPADITVMAAVA
jgi:uncharacterized protein YjiS (DUF1127 family)